jgi:flagella basal body P-ring formation protein FlgA
MHLEQGDAMFKTHTERTRRAETMNTWRTPIKYAGMLWATIGPMGFVIGLVLLLTALRAADASEMANDTKLFLDRQALSLPGDVEITVGEPDPRLNLAECRRYEPFIPNGARLWGRTTLGVKCVDGATWSIFLPVQIKVFGPAPVAARSVARGQALVPDDVRIERVEWTQWPAGSLAGAEQVEGRIATRTILAGEPLRRDFLRSAPVISPGDTVKIVFTGSSFAVATEGRSLTVAAEGQTVQAAVASGKILSGIARQGKVVELR